MSDIPNLSILSDASNLISSVVNQFVVKPAGQSSVSGFIFDIADDEEISLDSDITDHYVEANYAIQDHIALRPERFVLKGFIGELSDIFPRATQMALNILQSVGTIPSYAPLFTTQAIQSYASMQNILTQTESVVNQAANIYDIFTSFSTTATKQQNAYNYFMNMWSSRTLCNVVTPFYIFNNMAIEKVSATQRGTSRTVSDFSVTFKKIRTINNRVTGASTPIQTTSQLAFGGTNSTSTGGTTSSNPNYPWNDLNNNNSYSDRVKIMTDFVFALPETAGVSSTANNQVIDYSTIGAGLYNINAVNLQLALPVGG